MLTQSPHLLYVFRLGHVQGHEKSTTTDFFQVVVGLVRLPFPQLRERKNVSKSTRTEQSIVTSYLSKAAVLSVRRAEHDVSVIISDDRSIILTRADKPSKIACAK